MTRAMSGTRATATSLRRSPGQRHLRRRDRRFEALDERCVLSLTAVPVLDINAGAGGSTPSGYFQQGDVMFFAADDGIHGRELWISDGTPGGTELLKDINPGPGGSSPGRFVDVAGTTFLVADDGTSGRELWKTDGTEAGTVLVKDVFSGPTSGLANQLINVNGTLFFDGADAMHGRELWKSDGTDTGTVLVQDIRAGVGSSNPGSFTQHDGILLFSAQVPGLGTELWKSDGTNAGTVLVKDIWPGNDSGRPVDLVNALGSVFFRATDGVTSTSPTEGELWKTDGTADGTVLVQDIWPGPDGSQAKEFVEVGGKVVFNATDRSTVGAELWETDGTTLGTALIKDIRPGVASGNPLRLTKSGGSVFFRADDGVTGRELWKSDGTTAGTALVKDIAPGLDRGDPNELTDVNGTLFFNVRRDGGVAGRELWMSDGTGPGTVLVRDINPGPADSRPGGLAGALDSLFFFADDGVIGREFWKVVDATDVGLDVKPGGEPNPVNLGSNGMVPVAVLSAGGFDAATIDTSDLSTIRFGDPGVAARVAPQQASLDDADGDGDSDLLLLFSVSEISAAGALTAGSTQVELTAWTVAGEVMIGTDSVVIVGGGATAPVSVAAARGGTALLDQRADGRDDAVPAPTTARPAGDATAAQPTTGAGAIATGDVVDQALSQWNQDDLSTDLVPIAWDLLA